MNKTNVFGECSFGINDKVQVYDSTDGNTDYYTKTCDVNSGLWTTEDGKNKG